MVDAGTITDAQIQSLRHYGEHLLSEAVRTGADRARAFDVLFVTAAALRRNLDQSDSKGQWTYWRACCARLLNEISATEGAHDAP